MKLSKQQKNNVLEPWAELASNHTSGAGHGSKTLFLFLVIWDSFMNLIENIGFIGIVLGFEYLLMEIFGFTYGFH